ncbi:MAG: hypothetical protein ABSC95_05660 [Acetobacteraceae bacterium]|jgi:hypothetical protein
MRRVVVDVSTIARWTGPPVGIMRAQYELAAQAQSWREGAALGLWDRSAGRFRALQPGWAPTVLSWQGAIYPPEPLVQPLGIRRLLPSRLPIVMALERLRLSTASPLRARLADRAQRAVPRVARARLPA